ncbi:MAG: hypothetical protein K2L95_04180 [Alphaproteobacteria bacterium]|nr:hypothetical protein [Alphaproteobacteria bacterium]
MAICGNIVNGTGHRTEYYEFHCIPKHIWDTLRAAADDKCYENTIDYEQTEIECSDWHTNADRNAIKSPAEFHDIIQKCQDYQPDRLFICTEQ